MHDSKRFSGAELYQILESFLKRKFKKWSETASPLANEKDFLNHIIPNFLEQLRSIRQSETLQYHFRDGYEVVDVNLSLVYQRLLEIAQNRLSELDSNHSNMVQNKSKAIPTTIRFTKWIENLTANYTQKEIFLNDEISRCELHLKSTDVYSSDYYCPELLEVLKNELGLLIESSNKLYRKHLDDQTWTDYYAKEAAAFNSDKTRLNNEPEENNVDALDLNKEFIPSDTEDSNNYLSSSIEDYLWQFQKNMSKQDYGHLLSVLTLYFKTKKFPEKINKIHVARVNKKKFGWALNRLYRTQTSANISSEYLLFAKEYISLFSDVEFDPENVKDSNLYKYFTTKTE